MKNALIILGSIAGAGLIGYGVWRFVILPMYKFSFEVIDWTNKKVTFRTPLGAGIADYNKMVADGTGMGQDKGKIHMTITTGPDSLTFTLSRGASISSEVTILDKQMVDFKNKKVIKLA